MCGMILADFGADVIKIDRAESAIDAGSYMDTLTRGKRSIALDLRKVRGTLVRRLFGPRLCVTAQCRRPCAPRCALVQHEDVVLSPAISSLAYDM